MLETKTVMRKIGRPRKYQNDDDLKRDIVDYFQSCVKNQSHPTITGLAVSLGMSRKGLRSYETRNETDTECLLGNTVKMAKALIEEHLEQQLYRNGTVTGIIFNLKNNFNWKDVYEQELGDNASDRLAQLMATIASQQVLPPSERPEFESETGADATSS